MSHRVRSLARSLGLSGIAVAALSLPALSGLALQKAAPSSPPPAAPARTRGYEYPTAPRGDVVDDYF
ncbi:MAG TPA: hypothetical protein VLE54_04260, partial [Thermoanaerobaculia bacterium]|nr:hypothetical protein [Thermoanaerobaculia bacterium]